MGRFGGGHCDHLGFRPLGCTWLRHGLQLLDEAILTQCDGVGTNPVKCPHGGPPRAAHDPRPPRPATPPAPPAAWAGHLLSGLPRLLGQGGRQLHSFLSQVRVQTKVFQTFKFGVINLSKCLVFKT